MTFQLQVDKNSFQFHIIFVGMNPIQDSARGRTKNNIRDIRHVYLDLDRNGDDALEAIRKSPAVPPPNFVLDTSPGKHQVVWKVTGVRRDEAESLLHSLANEFGGDKAATDSTRVLRLAGFANRKLSRFAVWFRSPSMSRLLGPMNEECSNNFRSSSPLGD